MRGTANNTSTAKLTSLTDVSLLLRSSLGAAFVTQARMVSRPMQRQDCTLRPVVLRTDLPSPIIPCCYLLLCPNTTLCSRSELNFAVAIYCTTKTVRMRRVCLPAWFRARQHSNNGFGHLSKGPETASQSVAVQSIPCTWDRGGSNSQVVTEHVWLHYCYFEALTGRWYLFGFMHVYCACCQCCDLYKGGLAKLPRSLTSTRVEVPSTAGS